jgi:hypothetical protein
MARSTSTVVLSDGKSVAIRQMSWLQLRSARQKAQQESAKNLVAMGGAEFMAAWKGIRDAKEQPEAPEVAVSDPLATHDLLTVLTCGIPSYSAEQIEELSEPDAEKLGRKILALTPKPLTEDEEKNVTPPSTAV